MTARRDEARGPRKKWARMEQAIDNLPDRTATMVVEKVSTVVKEEADGVKTHITDAFAPFMRMLMPGPNESVAEAKARNRLELEALRCAEAQEKAEANRVREEQAAKKKEDAIEASREKAVKRWRRQ